VQLLTEHSLGILAIKLNRPLSEVQVLYPQVHGAAEAEAKKRRELAEKFSRKHNELRNRKK